MMGTGRWMTLRVLVQPASLVGGRGGVAEGCICQGVQGFC